jgi:hypothetical protein
VEKREPFLSKRIAVIARRGRVIPPAMTATIAGKRIEGDECPYGDQH